MILLQIPTYESMVVYIVSGIIGLLVTIIFFIARMFFNQAIKSLTGYLEEFRTSLNSINTKLQEMNIELKTNIERTETLKERIHDIEKGCVRCRDQVQEQIIDLQHQINETSK